MENPGQRAVTPEKRWKKAPAPPRTPADARGPLPPVLRLGDLEGNPSQTLLLHNLPNLLSERVLLVGCGKEKDFNEARYREVSAKAIQALKDTGATEITSYLTEIEVKGRDIAWKMRQAVEMTESTLYRFEQLKSKPDNNPRDLRRGVLAGPQRRDL